MPKCKMRSIARIESLGTVRVLGRRVVVSALRAASSVSGTLQLYGENGACDRARPYVWPLNSAQARRRPAHHVSARASDAAHDDLIVALVTGHDTFRGICQESQLFLLVLVEWQGGNSL